MSNIRIGQGLDAHKFEEGRKLILGGVEIPYDKGLAGHSDADVLLHAISDAILGAMCKGDIGEHFPDTDQKYKGISSLSLFKEIINLANKDGYKVINIDATIIAQQPKISPYKKQMVENIKQLFDYDIDINIKATTTEKMGFTGRGEGITAIAIALLEKATKII